jgi:hypothetical protein
MSQRAFSYPAPSLKEVVLNDRSVTTRAIGFERDSFDGPSNTKSLVGQLLEEEIIVDVEGCLDLTSKGEAYLCGVAISLGDIGSSTASLLR